MAEKKGNSLLETRRKNRVLIKNMIFRTEYAARTAIAEELGLTLPTITTSVNEMLAEGILEEIPMPDEFINSIGRRPNAVAFRGDAAYAIGMELGPYATRAVLMNMKGEIIDYVEGIKAEKDYEAMINQLAGLYLKLSKKVDSDKLLGVGIGLPGFIEREKGIIRSNPRENWNGKKLVEDLEKVINVSVCIDNNVRLRAIGHEMSMRGVKPDLFAYFFVSNGVACPLMVKEDVVSGYTAGAGEIGHMVVCIDENGNEKVVDELGSEKAIFEACEKAMKNDSLKELKKIVDKEKVLNLSQILMLQKDGDKEIDAILSDAINYLGMALANVVNLVNPGYVVVDSYLFNNEENKIKLLQSAKKKFFGLNEEEVQIIFSDYDE